VKLEGYASSNMTAFLPGPYVTQMLADHGADVIKIESERASRRATSARSPASTRCTFATPNAENAASSLDLKSERGHAQFLELAKRPT